ncbi:hypothetical protein TIFTF001_042626 [Ficus carica]|uniref:Uncharacterized protein n=1 Tax=Ficus carica TaxID=3494 RepID=A0AA88CZ00_FICCA|nr:hypothetical protein TIFTF001_042615 [Ficus carica]GMN37321.1 hypothetical protein TIFTF001_042618 [Ficus carica]GMN37334.1 hypothetical protein TIFTF001_042623 [Ficus carica]GMN37345.1 hypothetical protein TIFTF001_042626 [Ficus carica]
MKAELEALQKDVELAFTGGWQVIEIEVCFLKWVPGCSSMVVIV